MSTLFVLLLFVPAITVSTAALLSVRFFRKRRVARGFQVLPPVAQSATITREADA